MLTFADQKPGANMHIAPPPASELTEQVKALMTCALAHDMEAEVMLYFADFIRGGLNVATAIVEIFDALPVLAEPVDKVN